MIEALLVLILIGVGLLNYQLWKRPSAGQGGEPRPTLLPLNLLEGDKPTVVQGWDSDYEDEDDEDPE